MAEKIRENGYGFDILWSNVGDQKAYERFMYAHLLAIKSDGRYREHIIVDMCQVHNKGGGNLAGICTRMLFVIHCKSGNEEIYSICFEFFKSHFRKSLHVVY